MRFLIISLILLLSGDITTAQSLFDSATPEEKQNLQFNGYTRAVLAGGSADYDLSGVFAEFTIKPKLTFGKTFLLADLRFRDGWYFDVHETSFDPKELYVGFKSGLMDIFLGNQIVTWGRTDGFNPTNKITPTNYFFISPDHDDQKMANFMLRTKLHFSPQIDLDLLGIPYYKASVYRYDLFLNKPNVSFTELILPEKKLKNGSYGARLNFDFPWAGFSISWQSAFSTFHAFDLHSINWNTDGTNTIEYTPRSFHQKTLGADFSIPFRGVIIRGEGAYNQTKDYVDNIFIPNPELSYVIGLETIFADISSILQYIGKYTSDFTELHEPILTNPNNQASLIEYAEQMIRYESALFNRKVFEQQEEMNHAVALSLNRDFNYSTFNMELTILYNLTTESYLLRPMLIWNIDDCLKAKAGGSYMHGPEFSIFDYSASVLNHFILSLQANF